MKYFGGCDAGSTYTKCVIIDENGKILAAVTKRSRINPVLSAKDALDEAVSQVDGLNSAEELTYLIGTMYAKQYGLATRTDDEKLIGARIDAVIPELRLAFAFSQKGTDREAKVTEVLHFLCKAKRIQLFVIRQKDPIALATEIKQAFAKANLFINSDSQRDVAHLRKRYFAQKNNGN